jgi:hypothetical protein
MCLSGLENHSLHMPDVQHGCTKNRVTLCFGIIIEKRHFGPRCMIPVAVTANEVVTYSPSHCLPFLLSPLCPLQDLQLLLPLHGNWTSVLDTLYESSDVRPLQHPDPAPVDPPAREAVDGCDLLPSPAGSQSGVQGRLYNKMCIRPMCEVKGGEALSLIVGPVPTPSFQVGLTESERGEIGW